MGSTIACTSVHGPYAHRASLNELARRFRVIHDQIPIKLPNTVAEVGAWNSFSWTY